MTTVQIIIPAYNAADFIGEAIKSALSQNVEIASVIVLDNASTDGTAEIVRSFADRRIDYRNNAKNIGGIPNHNLALEIATADCFKILSADDVLAPDVLRRQMQALDEHPAVGLVTCNYLETDARLHPVKEVRFLKGYTSGSKAIAQAAARVANLIGGPSSMLIRRSAVQSARLDPELRWMADLDFACQMLQRCDLFNIDQVGLYYRRHGTNDSLVGCTQDVRLHDNLWFTRHYGGGTLAFARILYRLARNRALTLSRLRRFGEREGLVMQRDIDRVSR